MWYMVTFGVEKPHFDTHKKNSPSTLGKEGCDVQWQRWYRDHGGGLGRERCEGGCEKGTEQAPPSGCFLPVLRQFVFNTKD